MVIQVTLPPLEFTDCLLDSPEFRENLHRHEKELDKTSHQIKRIIKEVKELLGAAANLSRAQRTLSKSLTEFNFECIGSSITDDEMLIVASLKNFGTLIAEIETERDRMLANAHEQIVVPLEHFRQKHIGGVKEKKKSFYKKTAKYCQAQERFLALSSKRPDNVVIEADAHLGMLNREYQNESLSYVLQIQEVQERIKFEFVETVVGFMQGWLTFYHSGHEVAGETKGYISDLLQRVQKTRENFLETRAQAGELKSRYMDSIMKPESEFTKQGYLFCLEKSKILNKNSSSTFPFLNGIPFAEAFTATWAKYYCTYKKGDRQFTMLQYNQISDRSESALTETFTLDSCVRKASDFEKRYCFDLTFEQKPGVVFTFQATNEDDRKGWLSSMDGKEPTYLTPGKVAKAEEYRLDDIGFAFVRKCIEILETRGLEEEGLYRIGGVGTKIMKLINLGTDRRKGEAERFQFIVEEQYADILESKTVASALKQYLRNLSEPLMTYRFHNGFIAAVKQDTRLQRISDVHTLMYRLPKSNFEMLEIVIRHLKAVSMKSHKNKMSVFNLGVVFGPTLLRAVEETLASILDIKFNNVAIEILIENYDLIFKSPPGKSSDFIGHPSPPEPVPRHHFRNRSSGSGPVAQQPIYGQQQQQQPVMRVVAKQNYTDAIMASASMHNIPNGIAQQQQQIYGSTGGGMLTTNGGGGTIKSPKMGHTIYDTGKKHSVMNTSAPSLVRDVKLSPREISLSREYLNQQPASIGHSADNVHNNLSNQFRKNSLMTQREMSLYAAAASGPGGGGGGGGSSGIYGSTQHLNAQKLSYSHESNLPKSAQQSPPSMSSVSSGSHLAHKKLYPLKDRINSTSSSNESVSSIPSRDLNHSFSNIMSISAGSAAAAAAAAASASANSSLNSNSGGSAGEQQRGDSRSGIRKYSSSGAVTSEGRSMIQQQQHSPKSLLYEDPSQISSPKKTQRKSKSGIRHMFSGSGDNLRVRTLYACMAENDGELSFEPNQIITNVRPSHEPGWLEGTLHGKSGLIPENYVEVIP